MLQSESGHELSLHRWPPSQAGPLQAWDAADEHLLRRLAEDFPDAGDVLLVNDAWGALAAALDRRRCTVWSDSHLGRLALAANLQAMGRSADAVPFAPGDAEPDGRWPLAVLKIPKSMDLLADQLARLRSLLRPGASVLAGGMIKHVPMRAWRLLEEWIGPTRTSQGWKKSRLALAVLDAAPRPQPPAPTAFALDDPPLRMTTRAGVFGGGSLDRGTALLLAHVAVAEPGGGRDSVDFDGAGPDVADIGCGDGVLALAAAVRWPGARVLGVDESYAAVASARDNLARNAGLLGDAGRVTFTVGDGLWDAAPASLDLALCNPPFHAGQATGDGPAWRMINQAHRALRPGGVLMVVGNRHLGYHVKLQRVFGNHRVAASDAKFVVLQARR
jgi:23S rRNA (guanine1835-N2)-methyltransferase